MIAWCGFAGAWLLVIGPLYQGVLELMEQEIDQTGIQAVTAGTVPPPMPSAWWWLLPGVMIALLNRRARAFRRAALARMTREQRAQYRGFVQKASGWFAVATGASLLAVKRVAAGREGGLGAGRAPGVAGRNVCVGYAFRILCPGHQPAPDRRF